MNLSTAPRHRPQNYARMYFLFYEENDLTLRFLFSLLRLHLAAIAFPPGEGFHPRIVELPAWHSRLQGVCFPMLLQPSNICLLLTIAWGDMCLRQLPSRGLAIRKILLCPCNCWESERESSFLCDHIACLSLQGPLPPFRSLVAQVDTVHCG